MFEYLKAEAYTRLREEIAFSIKADLVNKVTESADFNLGRMYAYSKILSIVSKAHRDLLEALDRQAEKEAEYFESGTTADESAHEKQ